MPTPPPPPPPPHVGLVPVRASWRKWRITCGCGWRDIVRGERSANEALLEHTSSSNRAR